MAKCDQCIAKAKITVVFYGHEWPWCNHHAKKNMAALDAQGVCYKVLQLQ